MTSFGIYNRDFVTAIDGQEVKTRAELFEKVRQHKPGDVVKLTVVYEPQNAPKKPSRTVAFVLRNLPVGRGVTSVSFAQARELVEQAEPFCDRVYFLESSSGPSVGLRLKGSIKDSDLARLRKLRGWACVQLIWGGGSLTDASGDALAALPAPETLTLAGEGFTDVTVEKVVRTGSLRQLTLTRTKTSNKAVAALSKLKSLESLELEGPWVADNTLQLVGKMTSLRRLSVRLSSVSDAGLAHLAALRSLETFALFHSTRVGDAGLTHLTRLPLKALSLISTGVSDKGLEQLAKMTSLEIVSVDNKRCTPQGRAALRKAAPKLRVYPDDKAKAKDAPGGQDK